MKVGLSDDDVEKKWTLTLKSMTAAPRLSGGKNWWENGKRPGTTVHALNFPRNLGYYDMSVFFVAAS